MTVLSLSTSDVPDLVINIKINVKGSFNLAKAFLPTRNAEATVISINAGSIQVPGDFSSTFSAYNSSKFATLKFFEILAVENPDLHVVSMHPGVGKLVERPISGSDRNRGRADRPYVTVDTEMFQKGKMQSVHVDTMELPSHFAVWLCSKDAEFLRGKFVWANWDVDQIKAKQSEIENSLLLTANVIGWPFTA